MMNTPVVALWFTQEEQRGETAGCGMTVFDRQPRRHALLSSG
jgi:hypothetical protein